MTPANIVIIIATVLTLGIVILNGVNIVHEPAPPVRVLGASAITKEVPYKGTLDYRLTVLKDRQCPSLYDMFFISNRGDVKAANQARRRGGKFPISEDPKTLIFHVDLPPAVSVDTWNLHINGYITCPEERGGTWFIPHPPIPFEVVPSIPAKD